LPKKVLAYVAILAVNVFYGLNYVISKSLMPHYLQPFGFIVVRVLGAGAIFWLINALFIREKIDRKDYPRLAVCGLFGVAINMLLFYKGLNLTSEINASLIMITLPIIVLLLSAFVLKERITTRKIGGIVLGILGAALLILMAEITGNKRSSLAGDLFIFINATSYGIYLILIKKLADKYQPLTLLKWVFTFGAIPVLLIGWPQFNTIEWAAFTPNIWLALTYVVICVTVCTYLFNLYAVKILSPTIVAVFVYLQPILSSSVAIALGKDKLDVWRVLAAVIIFAGVYLVTIAPSKLKLTNT